MPSEEKGEGKDGGTLIDKVCEHCIETGLDQEFEQFCAFAQGLVRKGIATCKVAFF